MAHFDLRGWVKTTFPKNVRKVPRSLRLGVEVLEAREVMSGGLLPGYYLGSGTSVYRNTASGPQLVYNGSQSVVQMVAAPDGVDTLFSGGGVYFSPDGNSLCDGGSAYAGSQSIVQMVAALDGLDTLFSSGGVYYSPDGKSLTDGGSAYTGSQSVVQMVASPDGVNTLFSGGGVYFSADGKSLTDGGSAYTGSQSVVQMVASPDGVNTLFSGGGVYFSADGKSLTDGGSAYTGSQSIVQMLALPDGLDTLFSSGGVYYSPDGKSLTDGGSAYTGSQSVVQMVASPDGVDTLFSGGGVYFSADGKSLTDGGSAYTGSQSVVQMVASPDGVDTLFSGGGVYFSADGKSLTDGGSAYTGSQSVVQMVASPDGVNTLFSGGGVYFSADGKSLTDGGSAYTGSQSVVQMVASPDGVNTLFSGGGVYFSADGKSLTDGGSAYTGSQSVVQMVASPDGVNTLFSGGGVYFSADGKSLTDGGSAYTGTQNIVQMVGADGVETLFSGGSVYYSPDGKSLCDGGQIAGKAATLSTGIAGESYSTSISQSGSSDDCTYTLVSGSLPPGMSLSSSGTLTGTTTNAAAFTFTVNAAVNGTSLSVNQACSLTINPGAPYQVAVSSPSAVAAGNSFNVTVTALDYWGNGCNGSVTLTSSDGFSQTLSLADGTATTPVTDTNDMAHTLTFTATTTNGITGTAITTVSQAPIASMIVNAPGFTTAGSTIQVNLTSVQDKFGKPCTGSVSLYANSTYLGSVQVTNGSGAIAISLTKAGTTTLKATAGSVSQATGVTVNPAAPASISASDLPSTMSVGGQATVTVTVLDAYGNPCPNVLVTIGNNDGAYVSVSFTSLATNASGQVTLVVTAVHSWNVNGTAVALTFNAGRVSNPASISTTVYPSLFTWTIVETVDYSLYDSDDELYDIPESIQSDSVVSTLRQAATLDEAEAALDEAIRQYLDSRYSEYVVNDSYFDPSDEEAAN